MGKVAVKAVNQPPKLPSPSYAFVSSRSFSYATKEHNERTLAEVCLKALTQSQAFLLVTFALAAVFG